MKIRFLIKLRQYQFLFEELVKRDFKKKYKGAVLGMAWSLLSPLMSLLVLNIVFTQFFGRKTPHFIIYLFSGVLVFSFFSEATGQGMSALVGNAAIFTKVNVPKYLFLFSKIVQTFLNFLLTLALYFVFCAIDGVSFSWRFLALLYPIALLLLFNVGLGLVLSALLVFFRDIQYLWGIVTRLLAYLSAVFYTIDAFPPRIRVLFHCNPVYLFISYFRTVVIQGCLPSWEVHLCLFLHVLGFLLMGCYMYKKYNTRFLYYV